MFDFMNVAGNGFSDYAKRAGYCLDPALAEIAQVETYGGYQSVTMYF